MNIRWTLLILFLGSNLWAASDIRVIDDLGRHIVLNSPANRIITLSPHATEMLIAVSATRKIIAAADFFDYPDVLKTIPKLNALGSLDRERILALQPDLIIAWASGNRQSDIEWLKNRHIPVFMSEPETLSDIADSLEKMALLTGEAASGQHARRIFEQRIHNACQHRSNATPATVYYEIWPSPPMTIGGLHWLNEILDLAHLHNVFRSVPRSIFSVSRESLLTANAEIIITTQADARRLQTHSRHINADPTLGRPGPRIIEGLEKLCKQL